MQKPIDNKFRADFDILINSFTEDIEIRKISNLPMISIYFDPKDYPGKYVARVFDISVGKVNATRYIMLSDNLEDLRSAMPTNFTHMDKSPNDDPQLLEVWF